MENITVFEHTDAEIEAACNILRTAYIELSDDVMEQSKRFQNARHFGKAGIMIVLWRGQMRQYEIDKKEAALRGEKFVSPFKALEDSKEQIRASFASLNIGGKDFASEIE
jgi:hypothetical protein